MRWLICLVLIAIPVTAFARPKVAVGPIEGDSDDKVAKAIAAAADNHAKVSDAKRVAKAVDKLGVTSLSAKSAKLLRADLEVDAVIYGKLERDGDKHTLELKVSGRGKHKAALTISYTTTASLKKQLAAQLGKPIEAAGGADSSDNDPDDDDHPAKKADDDRPAKKADDDRPAKKSDDDRPAKKSDDDRPRKTDSDRPSKRVATDDSARARKRSTDDDDGDDRHRKKRHRRHAPHPLTQAMLWADAGAVATRRTLGWDTTDLMTPPTVGTLSAAARIAAEAYPWAGSADSPLAGLGFAGDVERTFGLGINVPGTSSSAPIKDGNYAIGARYRFSFGTSSVAIGASYWRRYYIADRSSLAMPTQLDMPDVDYTAIAPGATARFALSPTMAWFLATDIPFMLSNGPIGTATSYGRGRNIAFDLAGGAQIIVADHIAVQLAAEIDEILISFDAPAQSMAAIRGVHGATDRSIGLAVTLGVTY